MPVCPDARVRQPATLAPGPRPQGTPAAPCGLHPTNQETTIMTYPTLRAAAACAAISLCLFTAPATAHDDALPPGASAGPPPLRADGHAPIGVMGDHRHKTGEVMLSYRYMFMDMRGNRTGDDSISVPPSPRPCPTVSRACPASRPPCAWCPPTCRCRCTCSGRCMRPRTG